MADHALTPCRRRRVAAVASLAVCVLGLVAACGTSETVAAKTVLGQRTGSAVVLLDTSAAAALRCAMAAYVRAQPSGGIRLGIAAADQIANAVKDGEFVDVVVLPPGPALDRLRDELVIPPVQIMPSTSSTLWVGAVTDRGLRFTRFLTGRAGRAALRSQACAPQG